MEAIVFFFSDHAWEDYLDWQKSNAKILRRINDGQISKPWMRIRREGMAMQITAIRITCAKCGYPICLSKMEATIPSMPRKKNRCCRKVTQPTRMYLSGKMENSGIR